MLKEIKLKKNNFTEIFFVQDRHSVNSLVIASEKKNQTDYQIQILLKMIEIKVFILKIK